MVFFSTLGVAASAVTPLAEIVPPKAKATMRIGVLSLVGARRAANSVLDFHYIRLMVEYIQCPEQITIGVKLLCKLSNLCL